MSTGTNAERMEELARLFNEEAPIARYFGMQLWFDEEGRAVVELPHNPHLDHLLGGIHGGIYATLLDIAAWFTAAAVGDLASWIATSELTIHFLRPAQRTTLWAVGQVIKVGKRQIVAEAHLRDKDDRLVGHAVGTFVVLPNLMLSP